ncbi:hypothetical protein DSO57_1014592 [Entomophthora muscae]|uniref:Uncharacterized protein n=1 Tax=Entomophthora muscae TaxID=34485 RepID=A0ACC2UFR1_9FUNG|nr:hypothetical protein DSO57_1014592 [Entomophthora muscae]
MVDMLNKLLLALFGAAVSANAFNPCNGSQIITPENINDIKGCREYHGELTLDSIFSPDIVSLHHMRELTGILVLNSYRGEVVFPRSINGTLVIIDVETNNRVDWYSVRQVSHLVLRSVSAKIDFQLRVTGSIQVTDSSTTSIKGLEATYLDYLVIYDCPRLYEFQIDGLQGLTEVSISNTGLKTFDFLKDVVIEEDLQIENYKYSELVIQVRQIGGQIILSGNRLLYHIFFVALDEFDYVPVLYNNPKLLFIQLPDMILILSSSMWNKSY